MNDNQNFKNIVEAKIAVAHHLGKPLSQLTQPQLDSINQIINETLDKAEIIKRVTEYFSIRLCQNSNGEAQ